MFKAKGEQGKPLCTNPPYGYLEDKNDKYKWVVDEEAAPVVRRIFRLCVSGYDPSQIATELIQSKIPTPTEHFESLGIANQSETKGNWQQKNDCQYFRKN